MKIAILDDYHYAFRGVSGYSRMQDHDVVAFRDSVKNPGALAVRLKDFDVVVLTQQRTSLRRVVLEKLPGLRLIVQSGGHRDHLDVAACTQLGIAIAGGAPGQSYSTAELTWGLIIASMRHIPHEARQLQQGVWQSTAGSEMRGKTLGIYGLGKIGSKVAHFGQAFDMKVMYWGRAEGQARARAAGYHVPASREAFFESADVLSLHIHYYPETRGIVTADDLARMKASAHLINTGRAGLIAAGALVEALRKGRPGYAAVDVYEDEPVVGGDHPLLKLPNALCTPHLGYAVSESYERFYNTAIDHILAFAAGIPVNIINPEALGQHNDAKR